MGKKKISKKEQDEQKGTARKLFLGMLTVFVVSLYVLLDLEFQWKLFANLNEQKLKTFEPLAWALAALIGSSLYLIGNIGTYFQKIDEMPEDDSQDDFRKYTIWYFSSLLKAPILAVVIMWLLVNLQISIGEGNDSNSVGVAIQIGNMSNEFKLGIAFILGFFGRVAQKQLEILAKYIFTNAWSLAENGFYIIGPNEVLLGEEVTYKASPASDVIWSISPSLGTIGDNTGIYKAPDTLENNEGIIYVRATLKDQIANSEAKAVKLYLFKISVDMDEAKPSDIVKLSLETKLSEKLTDNLLKNAKWSGNQGLSAETGKETQFTVPSNAKDGEEYTITAEVKVESKLYKAEAKVKVKVEVEK